MALGTHSRGCVRAQAVQRLFSAAAQRITEQRHRIKGGPLHSGPARAATMQLLHAAATTKLRHG